MEFGASPKIFVPSQLGYRTQLDVAQSQRREVSQQRFTSVDRAIARDKPIDGQFSHFLVSRNPRQPRSQYVVARLRTLESMGLAEAAGPDQWRVRQDFETALRAMQRLGDRQKILAAHGVPVSDTRLPLVMFDLRNCTTLEGRMPDHSATVANASGVKLISALTPARNPFGATKFRKE
jgi:hypothetical protein